MDEDRIGKSTGAGGPSSVLAPVLGLHACKLHAFFRVLRQSGLCIYEVVAGGGCPGQQHHSENEQQNSTDGYHQLHLHPTTTAAFPKVFLKSIIFPPMVSYNDKGFGIKRISSITPYITAVWLWAQTLHVYEIRFPYLKDKILVKT